MRRAAVLDGLRAVPHLRFIACIARQHNTLAPMLLDLDWLDSDQGHVETHSGILSFEDETPLEQLTQQIPNWTRA